MIRLEGIGKVYLVGEQSVYALRDVTEHIDAGEHVALMGPSGSGKSTLLNIIGCLDKPSSGSYAFEDQPIANLGQDELAQLRLQGIGFVFQAFHLVPRLTALENVALPMMFAGIPIAERTERATAALAAVGIADWARHKPNELSGGQKQRVAIARATIMRPRLLLADEPTGNLDTLSGHQIMELLQDLNRAGITVITVTHDPEIARAAQRVLLLRDGTIVRRVPVDEISSNAALYEALAASAEELSPPKKTSGPPGG